MSLETENDIYFKEDETFLPLHGKHSQTFDRN
jgi:hypothetical protein